MKRFVKGGLAALVMTAARGAGRGNLRTSDDGNIVLYVIPGGTLFLFR